MKKKIIIGAVSVVLVLAVGAAYLMWGRKSAKWDEQSLTEGRTWMAKVDGSLKLNELTLPGSHDSCAWNSDFSFFSQCQYVDLTTQLRMGVRYLDIRISPNEDGTDLVMKHGIAACRVGTRMFADILTFDDVLEACRSFLIENPSESIVFCIKPEENEALCRQLLPEKLEDESLWYVQDAMPSLDEVRGKLVLVTRFSEQNSLSKGMVFDWADQGNAEPAAKPFAVGRVTDELSFYVQDRYCYTAEDKWEAVEYGLDADVHGMISKDSLVLQFLSTKGTMTLGHPYHYANIINQRVLETQLESTRCYGWIVADFVTPELVSHIYEVNIGR